MTGVTPQCDGRLNRSFRLVCSFNRERVIQARKGKRKAGRGIRC